MLPLDPDQVVCFCHHVTQGQLAEAFRGGADTLEKIQQKTCASTGCGGCQWDVEQLLSDLAQETVPSDAG